MSEAALLQDDATGVQRARGASVLSCIINLASTCMGTGILALPSAYDHAGFTAGSLLCVGSAVLTIVSLNLLSAAAELVPDRTRRVTFYTLCESALPHSGRVIDLAVLINCLGCCIAYLIVAADCFSRLGVPGFSRIAWVGLGAALVATPCHFSTMDMLKVTSSIAVASLLVISALILAFAKGWYEGLDPCAATAGAASNAATLPAPWREPLPSRRTAQSPSCSP
jgi:amino acid permease